MPRLALASLFAVGSGRGVSGWFDYCAGRLSSNPSRAKISCKKIVMKLSTLESYSPPMRQGQIIPG